jgi:hypothetical protein
MRVCFFSNFGKTAFFRGVGERLRRRAWEISWISPSRRWTDYLVKAGEAPQAILDLSAVIGTHPPAPTADDEQRIGELELGEDLTLANMILMDRALRSAPPGEARAYLAAVHNACDAFFETAPPDLVLGEQTWGWELMAAAVARRKGVRQYVPGPTRLPSGRVAFWPGYREQSLAPLREVTVDDRREAAEWVQAFRRRPEKPAYENLNARRPLLRRHWLGEARALVMGAEAGNPAAITLAERTLRRGRRIYHQLAARRARVFEPTPEGGAKPFVLFLLHVQPEASVDVYGSYVSDQTDNLIALARSLPATHEIYVKEHPSGLGCRSLADYRRLKRIPAVRLLDPFADTFSLIRKARLVASVSGTACFEAGVLGVPAITFAPMYFASVLAAPAVDPKSLSPQSLAELVAAYERRSDTEKHAAAARLIASVLASSAPAIVSDPISNPACMDAENLEALAQAIETLYVRGQPTAAFVS